MIAVPADMARTAAPGGESQPQGIGEYKYQYRAGARAQTHREDNCGKFGKGRFARTVRGVDRMDMAAMTAGIRVVLSASHEPSQGDPGEDQSNQHDQRIARYFQLVGKAGGLSQSDSQNCDHNLDDYDGGDPLHQG